MTSSPLDYEFPYKDDRLKETHFYLMKPFLSLLGDPVSQEGKPLRILDLGCGNGSFSHWLAEYGYCVVGVEESSQGVAIARRSFPDCSFFQGSIYDLPYEEIGDSFDRVIAVEVIEHLFYPKELVKVAKRCLKPNGKLILTTPYHGYLKNLALSLSGRMDAHFHVDRDGGHIKFFSVQTLGELLRSHGYTDLELAFAGRVPYLWKSMLCACRPAGDLG